MALLDAFGLTKLYATRSLFVAFLGVGLLFLGCLGPWATASGEGFGQTSYGFDAASGEIFLVGALIAGYSLLRYADRENPQILLLVLAIGVATAIIGVFELARFEQGSAEGLAGDTELSSGWGLWIAIAGSATVAAATAVTAFASSENRTPEDR